MDKKRQGYGARVMLPLFLVSMLGPLSLSARAGETQTPAAFTEEDTIGLPTSSTGQVPPGTEALTAGLEIPTGEVPDGGEEVPGEEETFPGLALEEEGILPESAVLGEEENDPKPEGGEEAAGFTRVIFVGDSRFVQMRDAAGDNSHVWIAKVSQGYAWLSREAVSKIDEAVESGTKVLLNLGVNDTWDADAYIKLVNGKAEEWREKGAQVYYASVNPVRDGRYITSKEVERFNDKMQAGLDPEIVWIDSCSWLKETGYTLTDGLHFDCETSERLYRYYLEALGTESKDSR